MQKAKIPAGGAQKSKMPAGGAQKSKMPAAPRKAKHRRQSQPNNPTRNHEWKMLFFRLELPTP
jgi:hypothetical protein